MKKFVLLFLVFSVMMLSMNLYAKERRGAKLEIWGKGDRYIKGELVTVKQSSLLLLNSEGKYVSVDIADIEVIRIMKKSKVGKGALFGGLVGAGLGIWAGTSFASAHEESVEGYALVFGLGDMLIGAGIGALIGIAVGPGKKTIHFEGMTDQEIQETLDYLRKKARVRDYK